LIDTVKQEISLMIPNSQKLIPHYSLYKALKIRE